MHGPMIDELTGLFAGLAEDDAVRAVVLTGQGKFFSFGFDVPELFGYSREAFGKFVGRFMELHQGLFLFPKPLVAALNGHTVAGGCMLALGCDHRVMAARKARIALNEITFGATVFAGCLEMLQYWVGSRNAEQILFSGAMYGAEEARGLGLVDGVASEDEVLAEAKRMAGALAEKAPPAFASLKGMLRRPLMEAAAARQVASVKEFLDIWYSPATREKLREIKIHS